LISRDSENNHSWGSDLKRLLPLLGHRNWIVVADAAYPAQSNPGIETIASEADHLPVVKATLEAIQNSKHVRAKIYLDAELEAVSEQDAPGVTNYREELRQLLAGRDTHTIPHEQILNSMKAASSFALSFSNRPWPSLTHRFFWSWIADIGVKKQSSV
jgi:D-ribose pyranose/furanose isomerase RbsD